MNKKSFCFLAISIGASGVPGMAASQTADDSQSLHLDEIVVTAQRRSENLQNVPIAVEAVTPVQLQNSGVGNVQELGLLVPGVQVSISAGDANTYIRGVGSQAFGPGVESPVALYVDGVYYASEFGAPADFINVAQVEVLKGPQGTLFGRNATGGLIQITTRTPTQETHMDADLTYGDYNTSKLDLYGTTGIASNLAADIAVFASHQGEGYGRNFYNGEDVDKTDLDTGLRSKWLFTPLDGTKVTTIFDYEETRTSDNSLRIQPGTSLPFFTGPTYGGSPWDSESNIQPLLYHKGGGVSTQLEQDLGFAQLTDIVAYREGHTIIDLDIDETATQFEGAAIEEKEHQVSDELQLQSAKGSRVNWTSGIYYFFDNAAFEPSGISLPSDPVVSQLLGFFPLTGLSSIGTEHTESVAGYAQAYMEILPDTNLTLGGRYTWERRTLDAAESGLIGPITIPILQDFTAYKDYDRPTYRVSLDHRFSPEVLAYVSWNTGFKSGGFNVAAPTDKPYLPENLAAYAVGMKNDLFNDRLRLNIEGFYYSYTDLQVDIVENAAPGITNAASAHDYGADVDAILQVTNAFRLTGGVEVLHSRYGIYDNAAISSPSGALPQTVGSVSGNTPPYSPNAVINLAGDYIFNFMTGETDLNVTYLYDSGYYTEVDNVIHQGGYSRVNASARWKSAGDGRYTVALWGKNLTDAAIIQNGLSQAYGEHQTSYYPPRTYGITVGYHF